jgi:hypothetical protein
MQKTVLGIILRLALENSAVTLLLVLLRGGTCCFIVVNKNLLLMCFDVCVVWGVFGAWGTKNNVVAWMPKLVDVRRREGRVWCADLLMDVDMWWGSCEVCVVQVGVLCPERSRFAHSGGTVFGLAGEVIMLRMEPLCVRMMQLASFTLSFT